MAIGPPPGLPQAPGADLIGMVTPVAVEVSRTMRSRMGVSPSSGNGREGVAHPSEGARSQWTDGAGGEDRRRERL